MEGSAAGGYGKSSFKTATFETGSINSGGKINISSGKNATFVGTKIEAKEDITIDAKNNINFNAAINTSESETEDLEADISLYNKTSKKQGGSKNEKYNTLTLDQSASSTKSKIADTGQIKSSGGGIKITGGKNIGFEGTDVKAEKKVSVTAGGIVTSKSVKNSYKKIGDDLSLSMNLDSKTKTGGSSSTFFGVDIEYKSTSSTKKTNIKADGGVKIEQNSKTAQGEALIQNLAFAQSAISGKMVDIKSWNAETKTEFAKKVIAQVIGINPSEVDITKNSSFIELDEKLKNADSINGSGPNSFDLKGFCKTLKP